MATDKPRFGLVRPTSVPRAESRVQKAAQRIALGDARIVVQVSAARHAALKAHAATQGKSIREYVLELLERDGAFGDAD